MKTEYILIGVIIYLLFFRAKTPVAEVVPPVAPGSAYGANQTVRAVGLVADDLALLKTDILASFDLFKQDIVTRVLTLEEAEPAPGADGEGPLA